MLVVVRIVAFSLIGAVLGSLIGLAIAMMAAPRDPSAAPGFALVLGCVGAPIGAIAGAAGEIVAALNRRPPSDGQAKLP